MPSSTTTPWPREKRARLRIFEAYRANPDKLPPEFQDIYAKEGIDRAVCDYISGMTDKFAVEQFGELFIPKSWGVK